MTFDDPDVDTLRDRLADPDPRVRRVALFDFLDLQSPALLPDLIERLKQDPERALRAEAARALTGWDRPDVVRALAGALLDAPPVCDAAAQALAQLPELTSALRA